MAKLLARLSPAKVGSRKEQRSRRHAPHEGGGLAALPEQWHGRMPAASATAAQQQARPAHSSGSSGAIPAFRPASPHHTASHYTPSPSTSDDSPGKAQLQAVRALRQQAPQQQQQQAAPQQAAPQQAAPQGTPGYSESSSVGRAINAHIASSIADLFMPTPSAPGAGSCGSGSGGGGGHHGAASRPAPAPNSATGSPGCAPSSRGSGDSGSCCSGGQGWQTPEAQRLAASPGGGGMPVPPPAPPLLRTAMTETSALELQVGIRVGWRVGGQVPLHVVLGAGRCQCMWWWLLWRRNIAFTLSTPPSPSAGAPAELPEPCVHDPQAAAHGLRDG